MADEARGSSRWMALLGLVLVMGPVLAGMNTFGERHFGLTALQSRDAFWWPMLAWTLIVVVAIERRGLGSIGLKRPTWWTLAFGVLGAVAVFATEPLVGLIEAHFHLVSQGATAGASIISATPFWYRLVLTMRAALVEEVVFRGYAIERIGDLTGSRALGAVLSVVAFAYGHLAFWGWAPLIGVSFAGAVLAGLYLWRRDLAANMIAHFIVDAVGLLG